MVRLLFLECLEELSVPNPRIIELINRTRDIGAKIFSEINIFADIINAASIAGFVLAEDENSLNNFLYPDRSLNIENLIEIRANELDGLLVKKLLELGINPGGVGLEKENILGKHWSNFYDFENGKIASINEIRNRVGQPNFNIPQNFILDILRVLV
jgi:hypothetical protein